MADPDEGEGSPFDLLPDAVLLLVFGAVREVKSLARCCAVSRRFRLLALQSPSVLVLVDCVVSSSSPSSSCCSCSCSCSCSSAMAAPKPGGLLGALARLLFSSFLARLLPRKPLLSAEISHHSPSQVLRRFLDIRSLDIVLPSAELALDPGALLRWHASFGRTLESCSILAATSLNPPPQSPPDDDDQAFCTNGGLKLRVVWTITSLIAASARHFLLREIADQHPSVEILRIADADGQGVLSMDRRQLRDFRSSAIDVACSSNRTQVPALNMKLWHSPRLVLGSGDVMEGATLVAIRPAERGEGGDGFGIGIAEAFDGEFREAARILTKRKAYLLEMNPF